MKQAKRTRQLEEIISTGKDDTVKYVLLQELADTSIKQRRLEDAIPYYERALEVAENLGDEKRQCDTLIDLGFVADDLDQIDDAIEYLSRALVIARKMNNYRAKATILFRRAALWMKMQRPDLADIDFQEAREAADIERAILATDAEKGTEIIPVGRRNDASFSVMQAALEVSNRFEQEKYRRILLRGVIFIAGALLLFTIASIINRIVFGSSISGAGNIVLIALIVVLLVFIGSLILLARIFFSSPRED